MNFYDQEEKRLWILSALDTLEAFVRQDEDFHGDREYESTAINYQRIFVRDGKYRVVFLGAFNVGKSTAINAFLGGGYLPMDVEECTSRLTFIQRSEDQKLIVGLGSAVSPVEIEALESLVGEHDSVVQAEAGGRRLEILCRSRHPDALCRVLTPLVTVGADEEYPHMAPLREKIEELTLCLPGDALQEDIVFVDTPGVHTISETRQKITYGIIEHCHLVVLFVDSGFVGNIHDLNFIKRIITCRGRRVFFVLNKADKLDNDEIDTHGVRGPAAQLRETFRRHGIPEDSDIFFLAGYRALRAQQLEQGHLCFDDALEDNKLLAPTAVIARIKQSANPVRDLAAYLMGQSRFPQLKERLLDFLAHENKAVAVVELADRFIWERTGDFLIGIRNALKLARDPEKFDELRANRELLTERMAGIRATAEGVLTRYAAQCSGGTFEGNLFPGYRHALNALLNAAVIEAKVIAPVLAWLRTDNHLKEAKRNRFQPLSAQLEHHADQLVAEVMTAMRGLVDACESEAAAAMSEQIQLARELREQMTDPPRVGAAIRGGSATVGYLSFGTGGAAFGAMTGAVVGSVAPIIGTAIGAGIGGLVGAVVGFLARLAWGDERWVRQLTPILRRNAHAMLIQADADSPPEGAPAVKPVKMAMEAYLEQRIDTFRRFLQDEIDNALTSINREYDALLAQEEEIRQNRETVIQRLEPKEAVLEDMRLHVEALIRQHAGAS